MAKPCIYLIMIQIDQIKKDIATTRC